MPRGGYRPGAGRLKGSRNGPKRAEVEAAAGKSGMTPLDYMLEVMRDETQDPDRRLRMASAAAPFVHPKAGVTIRSRRTSDEHLAFLREHPLWVLCQREGRTVPADVVDHIVPHKGDLALFWDPSNWQPLCTSHHSSHKQSLEKGGMGRAPSVGPDGWPLG